MLYLVMGIDGCIISIHEDEKTAYNQANKIQARLEKDKTPTGLYKAEQICVVKLVEGFGSYEV